MVLRGEEISRREGFKKSSFAMEETQKWGVWCSAFRFYRGRFFPSEFVEIVLVNSFPDLVVHVNSFAISRRSQKNRKKNVVPKTAKQYYLSVRKTGNRPLSREQTNSEQ